MDQLTLSVDGTYQAQNVTGSQSSVEMNFTLYLGGLPHDAEGADKELLLPRRFGGCMKELTINSRCADLILAFDWLNTIFKLFHLSPI